MLLEDSSLDRSILISSPGGKTWCGSTSLHSVVATKSCWVAGIETAAGEEVTFGGKSAHLRRCCLDLACSNAVLLDVDVDVVADWPTFSKKSSKAASNVNDVV